MRAGSDRRAGVCCGMLVVVETGAAPERLVLLFHPRQGPGLQQ